MSNNSLIRPESTDDIVSVKMSAREATLVRLIEAIQRIDASEDWSTLKTEIFDTLSSSLERELKEESKKENPNTNKLNRLSGELKWAERFADFNKYATTLRVELQGIRQRLHGTE